MYFKAPDSRARADIQIPVGYKGNAFAPPPSSPTPSSYTRTHSSPEGAKISATALERLSQLSEPPKPPQALAPTEAHEEVAACEICEKKEPAAKESALGGILSPAGSLDAEELLILALALIIFQGGKENELALLLIALLFIK